MIGFEHYSMLTLSPNQTCQWIDIIDYLIEALLSFSRFKSAKFKREKAKTLRGAPLF